MANTYSTDLLPSTTGLDLGSSPQRWDLYAQNIDVSGTMTVASTVFNGIYFAGSTYSGASTIQAAITAAGTTGTVIIPSNYTGTDTFTNPNNIPLLDLRLGVSSWQAVVNVLDYGVVGDGVTDDSTKIQACINANEGKHIFFPKRRAYNSSLPDYYCASGLTVGVLGGNTWLDGGTGGQAVNVGSPTQIKFASGVTGIEIARSFGNGVMISGLRLVGSETWTPTSTATFVMPFGWGGTSTADGIRAHARVKIWNVTCESFGRHGINLDTDGYNGNVNCSVVHTVLVTKNRGIGLLVRGQDSQACNFSGVSATTNQLDGIVDESFQGNTHSAHHTDANGIDQSADGSAVAITSSVVASNYATMTAAAHGYSRGDMVRISGTSGSNLNGRFFVLSVPTANTYIIYTPQQDRAVTVEVASAFKLSGAVTWSKALTGCAITSGLKSLIADSGGLNPSGIVGYPITIVGAGIAGADLVTNTTAGATSFATVTTWQIVSNVLTVNCVNTFAPGQFVKLSFFDNDIQEQEVQVATAAAGNFTANFTHADVTLHADSARVYFPQVTLRDAASTTVTGGTGTVFYRSVPYRAIGDSNTSQWNTVYSESSQNSSIFGHRQIVIGGDHGAGIDSHLISGGGGKWIHTSSNGFEITAPGATLWSTSNRVSNLEQQFYPGVGNVSLFRHYSFDTTTKAFVEGFRVSAGLSWTLANIAAGGTRNAIDANTSGNTDIAPTLNSTEVRLNRCSTSLTGTSVGFYDGFNTKVGSVSNAGLATFNGGLLLNNVAAPTAAANQVAFGSTVAATATNGTGEAMKANVEGYLIVNVAGVAVKIPYVKT